MVGGFFLTDVLFGCLTVPLSNDIIYFYYKKKIQWYGIAKHQKSKYLGIFEISG